MESAPEKAKAECRMQTRVLNIPYGTKNPYQNMMYSACEPEFSLAAMKQLNFAEIAKPEFQTEHGILHIQWDDRLFPIKDGEDPANNALFQDAVSGLELYKSNGGRVIWTIHNRTAHSAREGNDGFHAARRKLAELVDMIHVHTPNARQHMIAQYDAEPNKICLIPHPSYLGVYESAEITLARLMQPRDQTHFLTFGAMRGNRELDRLHFAIRKLTNRGFDFHMSVVGRVFRPSRRLVRRLDAISNVTVIGERVEDEAIPSVFSQAHAYVLPSTQTFTSGTAMLAMTFGLPVVAPDIEPHRQTTPDSCHDLLYPAQNPRGLIRMMMKVMEMSDSELAEKRRACFEFAQERAPERISRKLAEALTVLRNG